MADNKTPAPKAMAKSAVYAELATATNLTKKQIADVFTALENLIKQQLVGKKGTGVFTIPGLIKLQLKRTKAVKGGKVVPDPFHPGQTRVTKDKPAKNVVRPRALKALKDMVK